MRSRVKHEWAEMLTRGIVPVMEIDDDRGQVVVNVQLCKQACGSTGTGRLKSTAHVSMGPSASLREGGWSPLRRLIIWGTAWTLFFV